MRLKYATARPNGPDDTREFVGDSNRGFIVTSALFDGERPAAEPVGVFSFLGMTQNGTGTVGEQHPQVDVALFGDSSEPSDVSTGALSRGEPEVAREAACGAETVDITDEGDHGSCGEQADAWNSSKLLDDGNLLCESFQLFFHGAHLSLELANLETSLIETLPESVGQT